MNKAPLRKRCASLLLAMSVSLTGMQTSHADDIDFIRFSLPPPNNLIIQFDNSGSMILVRDIQRPNGQLITRLQAASEVLVELINNIYDERLNLNVGMMLYNATQRSPGRTSRGEERLLFVMGGKVAIASQVIDSEAKRDTFLRFANLFDESVAAVTGDGLANIAGGTTTAETAFESALYWRGTHALQGYPERPERTSDGQLFKFDLNGPNSSTGLLDPLAYGYVTNRQRFPGAIDDLILTDPDAITVESSYLARYNSPITHECQKNINLLVSDGVPLLDGSRGRDLNATYGEGGLPNNRLNSFDIIDVARFLNNNDVRPDMEGNQTVQTHAIGFGTNVSILQEAAAVGGGQYYFANTASDLLESINNVINDAEAIAPTLSAPSLSIDPSTGARHRRDAFIAVYQPVNEKRWQGNLKYYQFSDLSEEGEVDLTAQAVGSNDAVDLFNEDGTVNSNSRDFFSRLNVADSASVTDGGAATLPIGPTYASVREIDEDGVVTYNEIDLADITLENRLIPANDLGFDDNVTDVDYLSLVQWIRGFDVDNEDEDVTTAQRHRLGASIHSSPVTINYGNAGTEDLDNIGKLVIFLPTTDGVLHAYDAFGNLEAPLGNNPRELFAYVPFYELPIQNGKRASLVGYPREAEYGLDGDTTVWRYDGNRDGEIVRTGDNQFAIDGANLTTNDHALLYLTQRRGGSNVTAVNVSNPLEAPATQWNIANANDGTLQDFAKLGQTWSKPVLATIPSSVIPGADTATATATREVLIFGGGYDTAEDDVNFTGTNSIGNAIYMVDAGTGELLWWTSNDSEGASELATAGNRFSANTDMVYSIPAEVSVLDVDGNGIVDQLYFGDTGGQVWGINFDAVNNDIDVKVIAKLGRSDDSSAINNRRFVEKADLVFVRPETLAVNIGSGVRVDLLDSSIEDQFFSLQINPLNFSNIDTIGFDELGEFIPNQDDEAQSSAFVDPEGWRLSLPLGEKVLTNAITVNNIVQFQTYTPSSDDTLSEVSCDQIGLAAGGETRFYAFNVLDGSASISHFGNANDTAEEGGDGQDQQNDIFQSTSGAALPANPVVYVTGGDSGQPGPITSGVFSPAVTDENTPQPAYWFQSDVQ